MRYEIEQQNCQQVAVTLNCPRQVVAPLLHCSNCKWSKMTMAGSEPNEKVRKKSCTLCETNRLLIDLVIFLKASTNAPSTLPYFIPTSLGTSTTLVHPATEGTRIAAFTHVRRNYITNSQRGMTNYVTSLDLYQRGNRFNTLQRPTWH